MTKIGEKMVKIIKGKNGRRKITMERVAKTGFPQWKIISNKKA